MTFVKSKLTGSPQIFIFSCYWKYPGRAPAISVPGIGHSDIRGFGLLLTDRSMVRREPYRLKAWITVFDCANIVPS